MAGKQLAYRYDNDMKKLRHCHSMYTYIEQDVDRTCRCRSVRENWQQAARNSRGARRATPHTYRTL